MNLSFIVKLNLILISLFYLKSEAESSRSIVFFDAPGQRYIRSNQLKMSGEASSLNMDEVAASISVLLGFAPPAALSADSSNKLNEVLFPNPFDRPHAVLLLEVGGIDGPFLTTDYSNSKVGNAFGSKVHGSNKAYIQLPDNEVSIVPLDEHLAVESDASCADTELSNLALLLGGSYVGTLETLEGELKLPLSSGTSLTLSIKKKADRIFALSLVYLVRSIKKAMEIHEGVAGSSLSPAELMTGRFMGLEALKEEYGSGDIAHQGEELFQATLTKLFELLQNSYGGKIVGVVLSTDETTSNFGSSIGVKFSARASRWLVEGSNQVDVIFPEMYLVRRILAWIAAIILLVSTLIGMYFLFYMPLTRDTLLYSNVKLD